MFLHCFKYLIFVLFIVTVFIYISPSIFSSFRNEFDDSSNTDFKQEESVQLQKNLKRRKEKLANSAKIGRIIWPNDSSCDSHRVNFGENFRFNFLVSFPRSGSHWLRYMLESATGFLTGSVYKDHRSKELGFDGEFEPWNSGRTIVIRTHACATINKSKYIQKPFAKSDPIILLIRNPMQSLLSLWSLTHGGRGSKSLFHNEDMHSYETQEFHEYFLVQIKEWEKIYLDSLHFSKNVHVIFYENLLTDPISELRKVLKFLKFSPREDRLQCLAAHLQGPFKRNHSHLDPYRESERAMAASSMTKVMELVLKRNFSLPHIYKEFILNYINT